MCPLIEQFIKVSSVKGTHFGTVPFISFSFRYPAGL